MAETRKTPFGYMIRNGRYTENPEEAAVVRWIYECYLEDLSYIKLAEWLNTKAVAYDGDKPWNKNMVARILADVRYSNGEYPVIIPTETAAAVRTKLQRKTENITPPDEFVMAVSKISICSECGQKLWRRQNCGYWCCPNCGADKVKIKESDMMEKVKNVMTRLATSPALLQVQKPSAQTQDSAVMMLENELERCMDNPDHDESAVRDLALRLAAERYAQIGNSAYETQRLQRVLEGHRSMDEKTLFSEAASKVIFYPNGSIAIKLKNHQMIKE